MINLLGEFSLLDILFVANIFQGNKQATQLRKINKFMVFLNTLQEEDQHQIIELLKEIRNARKN